MSDAESAARPAPPRSPESSVNIVASKTPAPPGTWLSMPRVWASTQALMKPT